MRVLIVCKISEHIPYLAFSFERASKAPVRKMQEFRKIENSGQSWAALSQVKRQVLRLPDRAREVVPNTNGQQEGISIYRNAILARRVSRADFRLSPHVFDA